MQLVIYLEVAQLSNMYKAKDKTNSPPTITTPDTRPVVFKVLLRSLENTRARNPSAFVVSIIEIFSFMMGNLAR